MRHRVAHRKLGRVTEHRIAMLRNQATALIRYEHIETTVPKAKELRPFVERLITIAKRGDGGGDGNGKMLHARRLVARELVDREVVGKLFDTIAPRLPSGRAVTREFCAWVTAAATAPRSPSWSSSAASTIRRRRRRNPSPEPRRSRRPASAAAFAPRRIAFAARAPRTLTLEARKRRGRPDQGPIRKADDTTESGLVLQVGCT